MIPTDLKLVLLDRDGVINHNRADYVKNVDELILLNGAADTIAKLNQAGLRVAVVTNQSCIGRGIISEAQLQAIHDTMDARLAEHGAKIDRYYFAPSKPGENAPDRKPGPGMLLKAMEDFSVQPKQCLLIGDSLRDIQAAEAAGCASILVRTGHGARHEAAGDMAPFPHVPVVADLQAATSEIIEHLHKS